LKVYCKARPGTLGKVIAGYEDLKNLETLDVAYHDGKFDSPAEIALYEALQGASLDELGYVIEPKLVVKRYTLDLALVGPSRVDVELDGHQHEMVGGLPVIEDFVRDAFLDQEGWRVIRVPNHRLQSEMGQVVREIVESLRLDEGAERAKAPDDPEQECT
jgi:very-short-patch-repair endonuclease